MTVLRAAGRGLALGTLAVTLVSAAYAARAFLQTDEVKLSAFEAAVPGFAFDSVVSVVFRFEGAGSVYLDEVGYEPPVQGG